MLNLIKILNKMKTLIIGASTNPERYAYKAAVSLLAHGHEIELVGQKEGTVNEHKIKTNYPHLKEIDTVTMYVGPKNQPPLYDYILSQNPRRIIFNPGTENPKFEQLAKERGVEVEEACTLVLLATGQF
jgi:predicted CoA-binding protein